MLSIPRCYIHQQVPIELVTNYGPPLFMFSGSPFRYATVSRSEGLQARREASRPSEIRLAPLVFRFRPSNKTNQAPVTVLLDHFSVPEVRVCATGC